jgi:hypothetical protein
MKKCSKCSVEKQLTEFAFINKAAQKLHYQCNICRSDTAKKSYQKHKKYVISKSIERGNIKRDWFKEFKQQFQCCVCGESDTSCLDFHHLDPTKKDFEISDGYQRFGKKILVEELNKCACLCANCHRKYHAGRLNVPLVKLDITQSYEV